MPGYVVYWPKDRLQEIQQAKDIGPIKVVFGSIHSRMSTIASIQEGDLVFPITLQKKKLYVLARLPVERRECAYDYLVREIGNQCSALVPDGIDWKLYYDTPKKPHLEHQKPFNCCSQWAVSGAHGSSIRPRPLSDELLPKLRFGYPKSKEKGLLFAENGNIVNACLQVTRRLSEESLAYFEALFKDT